MTSFWENMDAEIAPTEVSVELCLRGDLVASVEQLETELSRTEREDELSNQPDEAPNVRKRLDAAKSEARKHVATFVFRSIGDKRWSDLVAAHPPKKGDKDHDGFPFHPVTFPPAAIQASLHRVVAPDGKVTEGSSGDDIERLRTKLSRGQWERLWIGGCIQANTAVVNPGKFVTGFELPPSSEPTSTTAAPEASPAPSS